MKWIGGKIRESPYQIEYTIPVERCETVKTSFEFESKMLGWTAYPADAERGIFINPAIVEVASGKSDLQELYSIGLIIDVPKPDFSMPFNALCLACTAVAILFGNMHSTCSKSVEPASEENEKMVVKICKKVKAKVMSLFKRDTVVTAPSSGNDGRNDETVDDVIKKDE